ncbi:hypothetical protein C0993_005300 [Termitomyces sp. T159_Od127]|nr:hypothetical protein C0993_005300 [Termitomyces sp. T159_Od127]
MTTTAQCASNFNWTLNSKGQSPCLIAAYLGGVCNNGAVFNIAPLGADKVYVGPTVAQANQCLCSGVFYNLVSACADCQGRDWLPWSEFNFNCSTLYPTIFAGDIPSGTSVPHYAYLDPTPDDKFNATAAMQPAVLDAPESTAPPQSTGTSPSTASESSSKAGPIAGGVVGGVVGITLIAALVFWWTRRRRARTAPSAEVDLASAVRTSPPPMSFTTAPSSFSAPMPSQRLYDPSDPSTYPAPITPATDYTGSSQMLLTHVTGSTYPGSTAPVGRYTGVPEV